MLSGASLHYTKHHVLFWLSGYWRLVAKPQYGEWKLHFTLLPIVQLPTGRNPTAPPLCWTFSQTSSFHHPTCLLVIFLSTSIIFSAKFTCLTFFWPIMVNFLASKTTCWLLITLCWFMHFLRWFSSKKLILCYHSLLSNLCMSLFLFSSSFAVSVLHSSHPTNFDLTSPFILFYAAFIYTYYKLFTLCCKLYPGAYPFIRMGQPWLPQQKYYFCISWYIFISGYLK